MKLSQIKPEFSTHDCRNVWLCIAPPLPHSRRRRSWPEPGALGRRLAV
jgi:hypothetical protein